ncbi:MAG: hypothetical protein M3Q07_20735 [Pseudobdellovibrionaceae bacterium]|nr:hypothetical protein [Pseudobdellovibrionaceae bacterium]
MKQTAILMASILLGTSAHAGRTDLAQFAEAASEQYRAAGQDSNSVSALYRSENNYMTSIVSKYRYVEIESAEDSIRALQDCVFYTKGAYGEHISKEISRDLAFEFEAILRKSLLVKKMHRIHPNVTNENLTRDDSAVFNAPCALGIVTTQGKAVILQGISID